MFLLDERPDLADFGPPTRAGAGGAVGVYVATELLAGRRLFAIFGDSFVQDRLDEHPWLLNDLACDPLLRDLFGGRVVEEAALGAQLAA
jgi:hypothetical protein